MKHLRILGLSLFAGAALTAWAPTEAQQPYPKYTPRPRATATATPGGTSTTASPTASPTPGGQETPDAPTGPLKMIKTDGKNKDSPLKVLNLQYYDSGFGSKYNSEVRVSGSIQNSSKADELKKVTMFLQIVDGTGAVVQEWKVPVGILKPGQKYDYNPGVWYNTRGITLQAKIVAEHEEVPKKKPKAQS